MRHLLILFVCLLAMSSFGLVSIAHAMEPGTCLDARTAAQSGHFDGDSDQVPRDGDKGYPHHHGGGHSHYVATPNERTVAAAPDMTALAPRPPRFFTIAMDGAVPARRPPKA